MVRRFAGICTYDEARLPRDTHSRRFPSLERSLVCFLVGIAVFSLSTRTRLRAALRKKKTDGTSIHCRCCSWHFGSRPPSACPPSYHTLGKTFYRISRCFTLAIIYQYEVQSKFTLCRPGVSTAKALRYQCSLAVINCCAKALGVSKFQRVIRDEGCGSAAGQPSLSAITISKDEKIPRDFFLSF